MTRAAPALLAAAAVGLTPSLAASPARASVTFGDSLGVASTSVTMYSCGAPCTVATTTPPFAPGQYSSPISGTVVRWRIQTNAGSDPQMIRLRVIAPVGSEFSGAGTGDSVPVPAGAGTTTFTTRLPIAAGQFIGLDTGGGQLAAVAAEDEQMRTFNPPLADGGPPQAGTQPGYALLINADVAAPPTSGAVATCSPSGAFPVSVTADPDPADGARAVHVRIDGGSEMVLATSGDPGSATIMVSPGAHGLEYWGEDTLGQAESNHHVATVFVIPEKPTVSITSDQATNAYVLGEPASVSVATNEPASVLLTDPSGLHEAVPTRALGDFTIMRTAVDRCGDTMTASFAYSVAYAAQIAHLAVRPAVLGRAGATISYRETHAATTTFVVQRRLPGTRRARYEDVAHFRHQDLAGLNRLHFSGRVGGHPLPRGRYRLRAIPRRLAGAGPAAYVWFRISR